MDEGPRCSDADRERFVTALQRHFAEGRLTQEEFSERVDRVLAARSLGELYAVTSDLPELVVVEVPRSSGIRRRRRWWRG